MALTDDVGKALIADHAPSDSRGTAMGIFYGLTGLISFFASLSERIVWDRFGARPALLLKFVFAILAMGTHVLCRNKVEHRSMTRRSIQ